MDTQLLKTFLEVAKTRHFGRTAASLFITQSAVSARIKLLEEKLGIELFSRKRNDIQLTPAGNRLHQHADAIVRGWERARQAVAIDPDQTASLAAGCIFDLWTIYVDQWSAHLRKQTPDLAIQIDILTAETLIQRLSLNMIDLAFMFDPPQTPDLEIKQVTDIPLILVSSKPGQSIDQALSENYIMVDWGSAFGIVHADNFPELPPPMLRTNSGQVALNMLQVQGGATYLPDQLAKPYLNKQELFIVDQSPVINRLGYAVYRPENSTRTSLKQALATLRFNA